MSYREEEEALRARNEALQDQLREKERELEALKHPPPPAPSPSAGAAAAERAATDPVAKQGRSAGDLFWKLWDYWWVVPVTALVGIALAGWLRSREIDAHNASFTRKLTATFPGTLAHAEGVYIPPGTKCTLLAELEGNGKESRARLLTVQCGQLIWRVDVAEKECHIDEKRDDMGGGGTYALDCNRTERSPGKSSPGSPAVWVDPGHVTLRAKTPPTVVNIQVEKRSLPNVDRALLDP